MKPQISPRVDYAFKQIFGEEERMPLLTRLLNAVINYKKTIPIQTLIVRTPINAKTSATDKLSIYDIKVEDERGRQHIVEMQQDVPRSVYPARLLYYGCVAVANQLREGENYHLIKPVHLISFVDGIVLEQPLVKCTFGIASQRRGIPLTPLLQIHLVQLPCFHCTPREISSELDRWLYFLKYGEELDIDNLPSALNVPHIHAAMEVLRKMSLNDYDLELYQARLKAKRDQAARDQESFFAERRGFDSGFQQGEDSGFKKGEDVGIQKGELIGKIQLMNKMLKRKSIPDEELRKMSLQTLQSQLDLLEQSCELLFSSQTTAQ